MSLIAELRQRKPVQWTVAYVAAALALLQGIDVVAFDRAYRQHDGQLLFIKAAPCSKNLEPDPRYKALLQKLNLSFQAL